MTVKIKILGVEVYYGSYKALSNIDLELLPGELTVVLGPNGAGKSTLLKTIARVL